ncbi:hypothetical protein BRD00_11090 [Halobacteriales archaeon QS_8_69_26]|nr:MAG: hypothetical protein BRD00_11090 [Halobacteriales archaeon QS_8_69_26]
MNRRTYLRSAGATLAAALSTTLAGCGGDGSEDPTTTEPDRTPETTVDPAPNLSVTDFGLDTAESGNLVVPVTVENVGDSQGAATLVVVVEAGGETYEYEQQLQLPPGESEQFRAEFDVARETFDEDGAVDFHWKSA